MRIEKVELTEEVCCCLEESKWIKEKEEYVTEKHTGIGYKVGYQTFCEDCMKSMQEAIKVFDSNKKIKMLEI